jgi:hypothetical protein
VDSSQNRAASVFPKKYESGFDVEVDAHPEGLVLFAGEVHVRFDEHYDPGTHDTVNLYRWVIERSDVARWRGEQETGFLDRSCLGRSTERVYATTTSAPRCAARMASSTVVTMVIAIMPSP